MAIFRRNKPKADFSAVQGGSSSTAPAQPTSPAQSAAPGSPPAPTSSASGTAAAEPTVRTYTVAKGDTLSAIAQREYGDANKWRVIFEANRGTIGDPDRIQPGQVLTIPAAR
jgi:nucleoid-associated protein YgaU